jgi:hypothetical protein
VLGQPNPQITRETLQGFAAYAGIDYTEARLDELMPSLQSLMADIRALWDVDVSNAEIALVFTAEEPEA